MEELSVYNKVILEAYEKGYLVDEHGDVFSPRGKKRKLFMHSKAGYLAFSIKSEYSKSKNVLVHKLQAYLKYGEAIFKEGIEVRHLNNDRTDNSYKNISIGNHSQNMMDLDEKDRERYAINAASKLRRYSDKEIKNILNDRSSGYSYNMLKEKYNIPKSSIRYIVNDARYVENIK